MEKLNIAGVETRFGYRTVELLNADITDLPRPVDALVVSAFSRSFAPIPQTVLGALWKRYGIDCEILRAAPALDLCDALGAWVSSPLQSGPAKRLLVIEMVGKSWGLEEVVENVFAALLVMDAKRMPVKSIAMPLLGTGAQGLSPEAILEVLLPAAKRYLQESIHTELLQFVEVDKQKSQMLSVAMDHVLRRDDVSIPHTELLKALCAEVRNRILRCMAIFGSHDALFEDWLVLLGEQQIHANFFGVQSRKLVERVLAYLDAPNRNLPQRIYWLEQEKVAAPWVCGYMTVLRHFGNAGAHDHPSSANIPRMSPADITAGLYCVERLLDFWIEAALSRPGTIQIS